jgi:hypothetical protein
MAIREDMSAIPGMTCKSSVRPNDPPFSAEMIREEVKLPKPTHEDFMLKIESFMTEYEALRKIDGTTPSDFGMARKQLDKMRKIVDALRKKYAKTT